MLKKPGMKSALQEKPDDEPEDCSPPELEWSTFLAETKKEWCNGKPGRIKRFARYFYDRFMRLHGSPEEVAWGAALGFFVAMTPTMGFQMAIAIPIAAFFRISKVAAAAAVWLTNPATAAFIYWMNYKLGATLLGYPEQAAFLSNPCWETFWRGGTHVIASLTLGGAITGLVVAVTGYFVTLAMVRAAREKAARLKERKKRGKSIRKEKIVL